MKNKQRGYTVGELLVTFVIPIALAVVVAWIVNVYKFANCDFASPYKCEIIHAIGIPVVPASLITAWFDSDN